MDGVHSAVRRSHHVFGSASASLQLIEDAKGLSLCVACFRNYKCFTIWFRGQGLADQPLRVTIPVGGAVSIRLQPLESAWLSAL